MPSTQDPDPIPDPDPEPTLEPEPPTDPEALALFGHNLGSHRYWDPGQPFMNLVKGGGVLVENSGAFEYDENGYPIGELGGWDNALKFIIKSHTIWPGQYTMRWQGTATGKCSHGTETIINPNEREYVFDVSEIENNNIIVTFTNGTLTGKFEFFRTDYRERLDAGYICSPALLEDVKGISVVRPLGCGQAHIAPQLEPEDLPKFDHVLWHYGLAYPHRNRYLDTGIGYKACGMLAGELDVDLWMPMTYMGNDACQRESCQQVKDNLPARYFKKHKVSADPFNEGWNSIFNNEKKWFYHGNVEHADAVCDPVTAICKMTNHNLADGDVICMYGNPIHNQWPYAKGSEKAVKRLNDDEFVIVGDAGKPVTDMAPFITLIRYKPIKDSNKNLIVNYAKRVVEVWAIADEVFGRENVEHVFPLWFDNTWFTGQYVKQPGVIEGTDKFSVAPYSDFNHYEEINGTIEVATNKQLTEWMMSEDYPEIGGTAGFKRKKTAEHLAHINGVAPLVAYESGIHSSMPDSVWNTPAKRAKVVEYYRSREMTRFYNWYFPFCHSLGITEILNFDSHGAGSSKHFWGVMEHPNDWDHAKYKGIKPFLDMGGVPKLT